MAGKAGKARKTQTAAQKAAAKVKRDNAKAAKAAPPVVEPDPTIPVIPADPLEDEPPVKEQVISPMVAPVVEEHRPEPAPESEPVAPSVMHFDVPNPGFVPEGFTTTGALAPNTAVLGFIPADPAKVACKWCDFTGTQDAVDRHEKKKHN